MAVKAALALYPMKKLSLFILFISALSTTSAQSFEIMPGIKRLFIDAQYLKFLDKDKSLSLFSRTRATSEYDGQATDLFTGAYLNYTTKSGVGGSLVGRISSNNSGIDAGIHFFKAKKSFMIFALTSINISDELLYSWFSILRYMPEVNKEWKLYSSLELFTAFGEIGHLSSVQRIRLGLDRTGYQFGFAINLNASRFAETDVNPGIFLRKQF